MTNANPPLSDGARRLLERVAQEGIANAAEGLSSMVGQKVLMTDPSVKIVPFQDIPALFGGPESEAVGIYLRAEGAVSGQFMLALPYPKALELADLLLDQPAGTTTQLGPMERSALAEVGNLTTAFFLNKVDALTGLGARPTPPAVMVDMIGAIIDIIIATTGGVSENVLMLHASLVRENREAQADFWLIPDPATIDLIAQKAG